MTDKSTVPVGTGDTVRAAIAEELAQAQVGLSGWARAQTGNEGPEVRGAAPRSRAR